MREKFFADAPDNTPLGHLPTLLNIPVVNESGQTVVELRDIDNFNDSLRNLKYTDFDITTLLRQGVPLKSLAIVDSARLGITDAMIEDYNIRLESIADQMFDSEK